MGHHYEFDRSSFTFKKVTSSTWHIIRKCLVFIIATLSLSIVYYALFALLISSETEKKLIRENRLFKDTYPKMLEQQRLIDDAISDLEIRDENIYRNIFHAEVPFIDPVAQSELIQGSDSIPDSRMHGYIALKTASAEAAADRVEENFRRIFTAARLMEGRTVPIGLPLQEISYVQVGASVGKKVNPFLKVPTDHQGLDLIASRGEPVLATAAGVVADVRRANKGDGNVVTIDHAGAFRTRYAHLDDIFVSKGQKVGKGDRIGSVGVSGNAFAPHLHYEIIRDTLKLDPAYFLFAGVSPDQYTNFLYMAGHTGQSLD